MESSTLISIACPEYYRFDSCRLADGTLAFFPRLIYKSGSNQADALGYFFSSSSVDAIEPESVSRK